MTTFRVEFSHITIDSPHPATWSTLGEAVAFATGVIAGDGLADPEAEGVEALEWWEAEFAKVENGVTPRSVACTYDHDGGEVVTIERLP